MTKYPSLQRATLKDGEGEIVVIFYQPGKLATIIACDHDNEWGIGETVSTTYLQREYNKLTTNVDWGDVERINTPALEYKIGDRVLVKCVIDETDKACDEGLVHGVVNISSYGIAEYYWIPAKDIHSKINS